MEAITYTPASIYIPHVLYLRAFASNQVALSGYARLLLRGPHVEPLTIYPFVVNSRVNDYNS